MTGVTPAMAAICEFSLAIYQKKAWQEFSVLIARAEKHNPCEIRP
jgi:hypothetical protein